jgi:hypothetical protein
MADNKVVTSKSIKEAEVEGPDDAAAEAAPAKKAPAKKKAASSKETEILIKMVLGRGYATGGHEFTLEHPFKAMPKDAALLLIGTGSFARATDEELKAFYKE